MYIYIHTHAYIRVYIPFSLPLSKNTQMTSPHPFEPSCHKTCSYIFSFFLFFSFFSYVFFLTFPQQNIYLEQHTRTVRAPFLFSFFFFFFSFFLLFFDIYLEQHIRAVRAPFLFFLCFLVSFFFFPFSRFPVFPFVLLFFCFFFFFSFVLRHIPGAAYPRSPRAVLPQIAAVPVGI